MIPSVGRIDLIVGPMFAGKTTEMLRRLDRAELAHLRCIVMKCCRDNHYCRDNVSTHDYKMRPAIPCSRLMPCLPLCVNFDVIGIDDGQFFPDIVEFAQILANNGKTVIVDALDGTYLRQPFGQILNLVACCESITKLSAVCKETGDEAYFTKRKTDIHDIELIGGADVYDAVSRASYFGLDTRGQINLTIGPVKSGKTTELVRVLSRHKIAGKKVIMIRPLHSNEIHQEPNFKIKYVDELPPIKDICEYDIIGVDEVQVFDSFSQWADDVANSGKLVVLSGLNGDSNQKPIPEIINTIPKCEMVQKLDSVCPVTGLPAHFNTILDGISMIPISRFALVNTRVQLGF